MITSLDHFRRILHTLSSSDTIDLMGLTKRDHATRELDGDSLCILQERTGALQNSLS